MQACLMHGNKPCAVVDPEFGIILSVIRRDEMPVGTFHEDKMIMNELYKSWLKTRAIPKGRPGMDKILSKVDGCLADAFLDFHGVSLTDTYWIREKDSPLTWEDVNFHANGFYPMFGNFYLGNENLEWAPTPDFVTDGVMEKFWMNCGGVPCLVKMDKKTDGVLAANEVFTASFAQMLDLKTRVVQYGYGKVGDMAACVCPCFVRNDKTDFITALQISHSSHSGAMISGENLFRQRFWEELDDMLWLDILIGNEDRHNKNYGTLRIGNGEDKFAPIFDSGSCLGCYGNTDVRLKYPSFDLKREEAMQLLKKKDRELPEEGAVIDLLRRTYERFGVPEFRYDWARSVLVTGLEIGRNVGRELMIPGMDPFWNEREES